MPNLQTLKTKYTLSSPPSTPSKTPTFFQIGYKPKAPVQTRKTKKICKNHTKTNKQLTKTPITKKRNRDNLMKTTTKRGSSRTKTQRRQTHRQKKTEASKKRKIHYTTDDDDTEERRKMLPKPNKQRQGPKNQDAPT
jgi:hypothetical protein